MVIEVTISRTIHDESSVRKPLNRSWTMMLLSAVHNHSEQDDRKECDRSWYSQVEDHPLAEEPPFLF